MWQPIDTAPKDGTKLDLWCVCDESGAAERRVNCYWGEMTEQLTGRTYEGWVGMYRMFRDFKPYRWMPIPDAPNTPKEPEGV